jgi:hypothetical protein
MSMTSASVNINTRIFPIALWQSSRFDLSTQFRFRGGEMFSPSNMKRKEFFSLISAGVSSTFVVIMLAFWVGGVWPWTRAQGVTLVQSDRIFEVKKDTLPDKAVKIKEVHNLQTESFPKGFAIQVENISDKPIYYIYFVVLLPETKSAECGGLDRSLLFPLSYGNRDLISSRALAGPSDVPIKPGETITLSLDNRTAQGFLVGPTGDGNKMIEKCAKRIVLVPQVINFGDGTGYYLNKPFSSTSKTSRNGQGTITPPSYNARGRLSKSLVSNLKPVSSSQPSCPCSCGRFKLFFNNQGCNVEGCQNAYIQFGGFCDDPCANPCTGYARCFDPETGEFFNCPYIFLNPCDGFPCI